MRILHVVPAFLPATAWGGPVFSTSALCRAAALAGHDVTVLTTDSADPESGARLALAQNAARFPEWYTAHYAPVSFSKTGSWPLLRVLPGHVRRADLVHLSMTYSFPTLPTLFLCRLFGKPVVWSPRGAIQATADWQDAPRKKVKTAFERLARMLAPRRTVLHVTAEEEAEATAKRMPGFEVVNLGNPVPVPASLPPRAFRPDGSLRLFYISRLHVKKGIDSLIEALADLPEHVILRVAGSGSPAFERALRDRVAALGLEGRVTFLGQLDGAEKEAEFARADAVVLPTQSENFGIAIAEGLAHGLPVVTTTGAPWSGIADRDCGAWIAPTKTALHKALATLEQRPADDLRAMGEIGHAWMQESFSETTLGARMLAVYHRLTTGPGGSV